MYQPTEQELLEMGFENSMIYPTDNICIEYEKWEWKVIFYIGRHIQLVDEYKILRWTLQHIDSLYPRSKEHLEKIILAFTKPE